MPVKINPSTTSTALDYGENPDKSSRDQGSGSQQGDDEYTPIVPHDDGGNEAARKLRSRKAAKKKERKKRRKIAERKARQKEDDSEAGD